MREYLFELDLGLAREEDGLGLAGCERAGEAQQQAAHDLVLGGVGDELAGARVVVVQPLRHQVDAVEVARGGVPQLGRLLEQVLAPDVRRRERGHVRELRDQVVLDRRRLEQRRRALPVGGFLDGVAALLAAFWPGRKRVKIAIARS